MRLLTVPPRARVAGLLGGALFGLIIGCERQEGAVVREPSEPRPVPSGPTEPAPPRLEADAGVLPDVAVTEPLADAAAEAATATARCAPVSTPPTHDVFFELGLRKGQWGTELWARIRVSGSSLRKEIWSSPAPTSCDSRIEGERMTFHCVTDEGELHGWVGVVGEEVIVESRRGGPVFATPMPLLGVAPPTPAPAPPPFEREASAKVSCGARLRFHPRTLSHL